VDLLDPQEKWNAAVAGCTYVQHIASPFPLKSPSNEQELIKPAVQGTLAVLKACASAGGSVKRIVLTSSIVSVAFGRDREWTVAVDDENTVKEKGHVFTEEDWTDVDHSEAYAKSKTLAERAAWDFVKNLAENKFELAVINPGYIQGPFLLPYIASSGEVVKSILNKDMPGVPHCYLNVSVEYRTRGEEGGKKINPEMGD
jgi:nucleoside-diphosphate-sugar epimerase